MSEEVRRYIEEECEGRIWIKDIWRNTDADSEEITKTLEDLNSVEQSYSAKCRRCHKGGLSVGGPFLDPDNIKERAQKGYWRLCEVCDLEILGMDDVEIITSYWTELPESYRENAIGPLED